MSNITITVNVGRPEGYTVELPTDWDEYNKLTDQEKGSLHHKALFNAFEMHRQGHNKTLKITNLQDLM